MSRIALRVILVVVAIEIPLSLGVAWVGGGKILLLAHLASAALGAMIIGYAFWRYGAQFVEDFSYDGVIDNQLAMRLMLVLSGFLMLISSLLTSMVGLFLLLPPVRGFVIGKIRQRLESREWNSDSPMLLSFEEAYHRTKQKAA
jgi:UPF0716 protein FxsA